MIYRDRVMAWHDFLEIVSPAGLRRIYFRRAAVWSCPIMTFSLAGVTGKKPEPFIMDVFGRIPFLASFLPLIFLNKI